MGRNDPSQCGMRWGTCDDGAAHQCGEWHLPGTDEPHVHICKKCGRPR